MPWLALAFVILALVFVSKKTLVGGAKDVLVPAVSLGTKVGSGDS